MNTTRIRRRNSDCNGRPFPARTKERVWRRAAPVPGWDADRFRKDWCGALIQYQAYGQRTKYGWEIDHIRPVSHGGTDRLANLQPLHWRNNRGKGSDWPRWSCTVS